MGSSGVLMLEGEACWNANEGSGAAPLQLEQPEVLFDGLCPASHLSSAQVAGSCRFLVLTRPFPVWFQESIVGNCMDRSSPGQAMQVPDHNGLGYPVRPSSGEQRPRSLQRHHTIQNSDDAYVGASASQLPPLTQPGRAVATQGSADTSSPAVGPAGL